MCMWVGGCGASVSVCVGVRYGNKLVYICTHTVQSYLNTYTHTNTHRETRVQCRPACINDCMNV